MAQSGAQLVRSCNASFCWSLLYALVGCLIAGILPASAQQEFAPNLCVVPVKNFTIEAAIALAPQDGQLKIHRDMPASSLLARDVVMLPGIPKPILYPWFGTQTWTILEDNTLETLQGRFPSTTLWDRFAVENESGRVLGADVRGVFAFDPGLGQFKLIVPTPYGRGVKELGNDTEFRGVDTIAHIARLGLTLIGTQNGVFELLGEGVRPLPGASQRDVGSITTIIDLPVHQAIMLGGLHDAVLRHDDGTIERLADTDGTPFNSHDQIIDAYESREPGRLLLRGFKMMLEVEMRPSRSGFSHSDISTLISSSANLSVTTHLTKSREFLFLGRPGFWGKHGLERLEADGLHVIPGEQVQASNDPGRIWDLTSVGLVFIKGRGHSYAYDGDRVSLFPSLEPDRIGQYMIMRDFSSIGMAVFYTERGMFKMTAAGVEPLQLPFEFGERGFINTHIAEFPSAHVGLIATKDNLYAISPSGTVQPIRGGNVADYLDPFGGEIPGRNAMLVRGRNSMHLILSNPVSEAACN